MNARSGFSKNHLSAFAFSSLCLVAVAMGDSVSGPEISLSIFYLIPGVITAWVAGRTAGLIFAIVSSICWLAVELTFGKSYQQPIAPYGNALLQLITALFSALLTALVRERELAVLQAMAGRKKAEMNLTLERALADGIEAEQQRLGRDIHDGLGQHLVSTGFVASMLTTKLKEKGLPEMKDAEELTALIGDAIGQSRNLARGLFPVKLEAEGLSSALQELTTNVTARSQVSCRFEFNSSLTHASPGVSANLYRIAQEAINNALKHAQPHIIIVNLTQSPARLDLSIFNDGSPYVNGTENHSGMGLQIMEQRARLIGASFRVDPNPSGGTMVQCSVPLESPK